MTTADQLAIVNKKLATLWASTSTASPAEADSAPEAVTLADGGLVQGWMKARRLLVIVRRRRSGRGAPPAPPQSPPQHAVMVFVSSSFPVSQSNDLKVETVLNVDASFKCEIDAGDAVLIKIASGPAKLMFEMLPGYHTQNFVSELYRQSDAASSGANHSRAGDFAWTKQLAEDAGEQQRQQQASSMASGMDKLSVNNSSSSGVDSGSSLSLSSSATTATTAATASSSSASNLSTLTAAPEPPVDMDSSPESSLNRQEIAMGVTPIAARESVVKYQMALKEEQFTHLKTFSLFIGTYNVNGMSPPGGPLTEWLACDADPPDVYAVGFQELDMSKEAFVFNDSPKEEEWRVTVTASLHPKAKYRQVKLIRLVGMMLIVFVKEEHVPFIREVAAETVGTGIMGKLGNKGGVAVRFNFHNTSICFVNSHLAAHVQEYERRNQDFHDICARMQFAQFAPAKVIKDHDMVYWLGDLNYRLTGELDGREVKELLRQNNLAEVLALDQLRLQRQLRRIFAGYSEGDITFLPTYKYDPGTDVWDSSEKARVPAWTDRVLWCGDHIENTAYRSHMGLKVSDHKPVSACFQSGMKVVNQAKYRKIYEDVMKKLDRLENEFLPQVTVDTTEILFDEVRFLEHCTRSLTVANTGQVPVQFEFIKKLNDKAVCKPWLALTPCTGFVMPGDKCDIGIEIYVDKKTAGALNSSKDQMYDILVLHLVGGKDIFITVSGTYKKSVFGASIDALCKMTVPISELSTGELLELEGVTASGKKEAVDATQKDGEKKKEEPEPYPVPKELWFLCDMITSAGLQQEQLFLQPGLRSEIVVLRDWLDTGLPVERPVVSVHSAAETLLLFLESLREPIVPYHMYARCLESAPNYLQCKQVASQLPFHHKHVFHYMCDFLREVIRHNTAQNGIDPKIMATLFAGIFVRDPPGTNLGGGIRARTHQQMLDHKKARFVHHFLVNDADD